jgi:ribosome-interacting GTPase 1
MPANLTPEYLNAEKEFKAANTDNEKLECLKVMLSTIPKHKGTDKLQADIKRRISKLRNRISQRGKGRKGPSYHVKPEGAGQIALTGPPNAGKSHLVDRLTNAHPEVAPYPFATREPYPAMMHHLDIRVQLVDLPPVSTEHTEHWVYDAIKSADGVLVVLNIAGEDPVREFSETMDLLEKKKIYIGSVNDGAELPRGSATKKSIIALTHAEEDPTGEVASLFKELSKAKMQTIPVSDNDNRGLEKLRKSLYDMLGVIRVYSKIPGRPVDQGEPYTIPAGSNLMYFAEHVHKDFAVKLRFARCWGSAKFDGQSVPHEHILQDGDVIELHI